jgi:5'-3' exonuclease
VRFICIKDINEIKKEIGQYRYKVSGFESDDIGGMPMREFYRTHKERDPLWVIKI